MDDKKGTERTNERLELRSRASRRIASLFLAHSSLTLRQIYQILKQTPEEATFSKSAVRGALYRLSKRNILLSFVDFAGIRYVLNPQGGREIILNALQGTPPVRDPDTLELVSSEKEPVRAEKKPVMIGDIEIIPRWWDMVFDFRAAFQENARIYCRVDEHIAIELWKKCPRKAKDAGRGISASFRGVHFTFKVWQKGKYHIYTKKNPRWIDEFGEFLKKAGLGVSDLRLMAWSLEEGLSKSLSTTELPLKRSVAPVTEYEMRIEMEDRVATLKLVRSHFADLGEIEARGDLRFSFDWLGMLSGATMEVMSRSRELEQLTLERAELKKELDEIKDILARVSDKLAKTEEKVKAHDDVIQEKQKETAKDETEERTPNYDSYG